MADVVYPYDRLLYSRLFLNCYQRQSMVMLAQRVPVVHHVLSRCLISTDDLLEQVVRQRRPKYDFESEFLRPEDLSQIGVVPTQVPFESFAEARDLLHDVVARQGFAILVGDVFYWPHCPEYRAQHLVHSVTLTGHDAETGEWSLVDDNPASLLCRYTYPEHLLAAGFDNGELRRIRYFTVQEVDEAEAARATRRAFSQQVQEYRDSLALLANVTDILDCPWTAVAGTIGALHDAFSLYQGSRIALLEYVTRVIADAELEAALDHLVKQAETIQNQLLLGKVLGTVDTGSMGSGCRELKAAEETLLSRLQDVAVVRDPA